MNDFIMFAIFLAGALIIGSFIINIIFTGIFLIIGLIIKISEYIINLFKR